MPKHMKQGPAGADADSTREFKDGSQAAGSPAWSDSSDSDETVLFSGGAIGGDAYAGSPAAAGTPVPDDDPIDRIGTGSDVGYDAFQSGYAPSDGYATYAPSAGYAPAQGGYEATADATVLQAQAPISGVGSQDAGRLVDDTAAKNPVASGGGKRRRRRLWIVPLVLLVLVAAVYLGGVAYFSGVFPPGTTIDGEDVSLMSHEDVAAEKSASHDDYTLHASGNGLDITVSASDIGLSVDGTAYVEEAAGELSPWAWPLSVASPDDLTAEESVTYDEESLSAIVTSAVDAVTSDVDELGSEAIVYSAEQGAFLLDGSLDQRRLNADAVTEVMGQAALALQAEVEIGDDCLEDASGTLSDALSAANALLGAAGTTLTMNGTEVLSVPADLLASWVVIGDDLSVTLDEDAVATWVTENVGALDTAGAERTYTRADGKQVTVSGGTYGTVTNEDETTTSLLEILRGGTAQALEIPLRQSTGVTPDAGGRDWGNRYIDIDLTEQHVYMYDDSGTLIWESDCVTGDTTQGYDTPTGVYAVNSNKAMNQTLQGLDYDGDGEPDYTSYVTYWIPFVNNLIALHDADWRSSFGGTIYQGNGSHGCVNLPVDKAAQLYELAQVGDCVVVHY